MSKCDSVLDSLQALTGTVTGAAASAADHH